MWIHPKDEVTYQKQKLVIKCVEGLYSCGPVQVLMQNTATGKDVRIPLMEFNQLHDDGKLTVKKMTSRPVGF